MVLLPAVLYTSLHNQLYVLLYLRAARWADFGTGAGNGVDLELTHAVLALAVAEARSCYRSRWMVVLDALAGLRATVFPCAVLVL